MRNRNLDKQYVVTGFPFSLWNMTYATPLPHAWEWKKLRELTLHIYKCDPADWGYRKASRKYWESQLLQENNYWKKPNVIKHLSLRISIQNP